MHAAMQMVYELPFSAIMYALRLKRAVVVESGIGSRAGRQRRSVVVKIVDSDLELAAQPIEKRGVLACCGTR